MLTALGTYLLTETNQFVAGEVTLFLLAGLLTYTVAELMREPIWDAAFFSNYLKYEMFSRKHRLEYSDINKVERLLVTNPLKLKRHPLIIYPKYNLPPMVIPMNQKNWYLKSDLFSWLQTRIGTSNPPDSEGQSDHHPPKSLGRSQE